MAEHSPTPWKTDTDGHIVGTEDGRDLMVIGDADVARIVACVNAFPDDIPTEAITEGLVEEMLDTLKACLHTMEHAYGGADNFAALEKSRARALLAKLEARDA